MFNILDFGARGDADTHDTQAIQAAIDACSAAGGGSVLIPGGRTYLSGQIDLKSHTHVHLEGGARLMASKDPAAYRDGTFLSARNAVNCSIGGPGELFGRGVEFMQEDRGAIYWLDREHTFRPRMIHWIGCQNVSFRDLTIRDAPVWSLHLTGCEDVLIQGIRILNNLKVPNCDGIDPDHCRNVRISDCHIEAGDDCIVLKTLKEYNAYGPCENITVTGCTLVSTSSALKIGTESCADIRNVIFDACVIRNSNRGLSIQLRDNGCVENVVFSNMIVETRLFADDWWGKAEPIYVTALHRTPGSELGRVRHVRFSNILCRGENGVFLCGSPDSPLEDVVLENVRIEIDKTSRWPGGVQDLRPPEVMGTPIGVRPHATNGVYIEHARQAALRNVQVAWGQNRPEYFGTALEQHAVDGLEVLNFQGENAHP
jgi:hypothetical protein